jgi:hypothetical protein
LLPALKTYLIRDHKNKPASCYASRILPASWIYLFGDNKTKKQAIMLLLLAYFLHHGYIFSGITRLKKQAIMLLLLACFLFKEE